MADDSTNDNTNLQPDPQETLDANGGTPDVTPSALVGNSTAPDMSSPAVMPNPQSPGSPDEQDMDTQTSGGQNATSGAADGAQGGSGSMWQRILQGALAGLAGQQQHGRSSIANGIIGGAKGAEVAQQQQQENDRANAELQSNIKFRNLQSAQMLATAARQDKELALSTQEHNDAHDANARAAIDWLQSHGVDGDIIPNTPAATTNALQNASAASPDGVNVPPGLVHGSNFVFIPKNDSEDVNSEYKQVSDLSAAMGMPVPSQSQFQNISSDKRDSLRDGLLQMAKGNDRTGALIPAAQLPQQITQAKSALAAYQSSPTADPATVKLIQARIANMQQQSDDIDTHLAKQEKQKALAKTAETKGPDTESMIRTGIDKNTGQRLNLDNAPDEAMVDLRTGNPVPTSMTSTLKADLQERNRADFSRSALHTLDDLESLQQQGKLPNGPLKGLTKQQLAEAGMGDADAQRAINDISLMQSASTGAHVGGRFSVPVLQKMQGLLDLNMNDSQLSGAIDSVRNVLQPYIDNGRTVTVAEYRQMEPAERARLKTSTGGYTPPVQTSAQPKTPTNGGKAGKYGVNPTGAQ